MKKIISRTISSVLIVSLILTLSLSTFSDEFIESSVIPANGLKPMHQETIDSHRISVQNYINSTSRSSENILPDTVDLSSTIYFPPIRNQGVINSCVAFASVYYQYTYEVNSLLGTSAQLESNQYSPNWPYYAMITEQANVGLNYSNMYTFLTDHGALKWTDDEFDHTSFNSSMPWPTDEALVKDAMLIRVSDWYTIELDSVGTLITSNKDADLDAIKTLLSNQKVITVGMYWGDHYSDVDDSGKTIFYRVGIPNNRAGHAVTIVGYDDNITYDIDNDGIIEDGEKGAFKIANSHGEDFGNEGYFWMMYDALNGVSSVNGSWDNSNTRVAAFAAERYVLGSDTPVLGDNLFMYMDVEQKNPLLLAKTDLTSHDRYLVQLNLLNKPQNDPTVNSYTTSYATQDYIVPNNRTLFFDYEELISSFDDIMTSTYWGVEIMGYSNNAVDIVSSIKIVDNKDNVVKVMGAESGSETIFSCNTDFEYGDVNYDGVLSDDDVSIIMQIAANHSSISNLQKMLGDYNGDGIVNARDATALSWDIE